MKNHANDGLDYVLFINDTDHEADILLRKTIREAYGSDHSSFEQIRSHVFNYTLKPQERVAWGPTAKEADWQSCNDNVKPSVQGFIRIKIDGDSEKIIHFVPRLSYLPNRPRSCSAYLYLSVLKVKQQDD